LRLHAWLVFATNQIKLFAVGGIRQDGYQPSGNVIAEIFLKRHCGNLRHENSADLCLV